MPNNALQRTEAGGRLFSVYHASSRQPPSLSLGPLGDPATSTQSISIMKPLFFLFLIVGVVSTAAAQNLQVEIRATYDGFDLPVVLHSSDKTVAPNEAIKDAKQVAPGIYQDTDQIFDLKQPLTGPSVTLKLGQQGTVEIVREIDVHGAARKVPAGFILEVTPTLREGRLVLTGKSTVRRVLSTQAAQTLAVGSFSTREVLFDGIMEDGKPVVIQAGDGTTDKAQITLTAKMISVHP